MNFFFRGEALGPLSIVFNNLGFLGEIFPNMPYVCSDQSLLLGPNCKCDITFMVWLFLCFPLPPSLNYKIVKVGTIFTSTSPTLSS